MSVSNKPAMTQQQQAFSAGGSSAISLYRELVVGDGSLLSFLGYEFCMTFLSGIPGLIGLGARALVYPALFGSSGKRAAFGRGVILRRPSQMFLGRGVLVDDYAALDVRGASASIRLGDHVSVGRYSSIVSRGQEVELANGANIGSYCRIATESKISIGESVLVAAYSYIGPGNHRSGDGDKPLIAQEMEIRGGVVIEKHAWIGSHVTVMDGVTIGEGAIIGAHAFVTTNIPARTLAVGSPAKVIREL